MKINFLVLCTIALCLTANLSVAQNNPNKVTIIENVQSTSIIIGIDGMACQEGCADKIAANLNEKEGVISAEVSFEEKNGVIVFDPKIISIEDLKSVITNTKVKEYEYSIKKVIIKERN